MDAHNLTVDYALYDADLPPPFMVNESMTVRCFPPESISWYSFLLNGLLTSLLVALGLLGNSALLAARCGRRRRRRPSGRLAHLLVALSLWDCLLLLSTFGFYGGVSLVTGTKPWNGFATYLYIVFYPLTHISMTGSMWMVVTITAERYLAVARPLQQRMREDSPVSVICLFIAAGSLLINLPTMFELTLDRCEADGGAYLPQINVTWLRNQAFYKFYYRVVCYLIFTSGVPFVLVVFLTARTLCIRRTAIATRRKYSHATCAAMNAKRRHRSNTAALLTAVIVKFLLCYTMPTAVNILEYVDRTLIFSRLVDLNNILVVFHSATNWLIFCHWRQTSRPSTQSHTSTPRRVQLSASMTQLQSLLTTSGPLAAGNEALFSMIGASTRPGAKRRVTAFPSAEATIEDSRSVVTMTKSDTAISQPRCDEYLPPHKANRLVLWPVERSTRSRLEADSAYASAVPLLSGNASSDSANGQTGNIDHIEHELCARRSDDVADTMQRCSASANQRLRFVCSNSEWSAVQSILRRRLETSPDGARRSTDHLISEAPNATQSATYDEDESELLYV